MFSSILFSQTLKSFFFLLNILLSLCSQQRNKLIKNDIKMQAVARQRQKLQGIVKPPRLEKLEAEEANVAREDNETGGVPR